MYEDAIHTDEALVHHSILTPMLNIGLISPQDIITQAITYGKENSIPLNSFEGFVRQIIGWREYIRGLYGKIHVQQRTKNFWNHSRPIPKRFYTGET